MRELSEQTFQIREQTLDSMIDDQVLKQEASRLKRSVKDLLDEEVDSQVSVPTSSDVEGYYLGIKDRIGRPLEEVRPQIIASLTEARRRNAYDNYLSGLRLHARVVVLLAPPRAVVAVDPKRVRGPANAPVTVVEFSDFQCPYCGAAEDTLHQLTLKYPVQIRLAYRDFPLDFHPRSRPAAEASRCALAQGKYWQYHDLLFANQQHLEDGDLSKFAGQLGMDLRSFNECLTRKTYADDIRHDVEDGEKLGTTGTPEFFVNGIAVHGAVSLDELSRIVDAELARTEAK
jgi:protein-disulfide isomerase